MKKSFKGFVSLCILTTMLFAVTFAPTNAALPTDTSKIMINENFDTLTEIPSTDTDNNLKYTLNSNITADLGVNGDNKWLVVNPSTDKEPSITVNPIDGSGTAVPFNIEAGKNYMLQFDFTTDKVGTDASPLAALEYIVTFTNGTNRIQPITLTKNGSVQFFGTTSTAFDTTKWYTAKLNISKSQAGDIVVSAVSLVNEAGVSYAAGADRTIAGMQQIDSIKFASARNAGNLSLDNVAFYEMEQPVIPEIPADSQVLINESFETKSKIPAGTNKAVTSDGFTWTYGPSTNYVAPSIYNDDVKGNVLKLGPALSDLNLTLSGFALTQGQKYALKFDFMTDKYISAFKDLLRMQDGIADDYTLRINSAEDALISSGTVTFDTDTVNKWYSFEALVTPNGDSMDVALTVKNSEGAVLGIRNFKTTIKPFVNLRFATKANGGALYLDNLQVYTVNDEYIVENHKLASDSEFTNPVALTNVAVETDVHFKTDFKQLYAASGAPVIMVAAYESGNNKLAGVKMFNISALTSENGVYTLQTASPLFHAEAGKSYNVKVMTWGGIDNIIPRMTTVSYTE